MKPSLPARGALALIRCYQLVLSPVLHLLCGSQCGCRYYPTCSEYGAESVRRFGVIRGTTIAVFRIVRCAPWGRGGIDPVPANWREALPFRSRSAQSAPTVAQPANADCCHHQHG